MAKWVQRFLTIAGTWLSRPLAVGVVLVYTILWLALEPGSFGWHGAATIATLLMTLFIQRAEHRDTQAIHAKLDELLRVHGDARDGLTNLDERQPEQIEAFRNRTREENAE
jgi:low affinity Fe/Cu permease